VRSPGDARGVTTESGPAHHQAFRSQANPLQWARSRRRDPISEGRRGANCVQYRSAIFKGDWSGALDGVRKFIAGFGDFLAAGPKMVGDFLKGIKTGFAPLDQFLHTIGKLFTDLGRLVQEVFQGDWKGALTVAERLFFHLVDAVTQGASLIWTGIKAGCTANDWGALFSTIVDALKGAGKWLLAKDKELIKGLWNGIVDEWPVVAAWLADTAMRVLRAIPGLLATLADKGMDLVRGFFNGAFGFWRGLVKPWLGYLATRVLNAVPKLLGTLKDKGTDIISGFYSGITEKWKTVSEWFRILPTNITNVITSGARDVGGMIGLLVQIGRDVIDGFRSAAQNFWRDYVANVNTWNPLGLLADIGDQIVHGLSNGLYAGARYVTEAVDYLVGLIPDSIKHLMGLNSPSKVMVKLALGIPQGMAVGIRDGTNLVSSAAAQLASAATVGGASGYGLPAPSSMAADGSGGITINGGVNITLSGAGDPDAVADRVFDKFSRELGLREGV
jgi:phage-related protein